MKLLLLERDRDIKEDILGAIWSIQGPDSHTSNLNAKDLHNGTEGSRMTDHMRLSDTPDRLDSENENELEGTQDSPCVSYPTILNIDSDIFSSNDILHSITSESFTPERSVSMTSTPISEMNDSDDFAPSTPACIFKGKVKANITDSTRKALARNIAQDFSSQ